LNLQPKATNRVIAIGPTGCGKSFLMEWLLSHYPDVVKVDFKHDIRATEGDLIAKDLRSLEKRLSEADNQHIIYRVPQEHLNPDNSSYLDAVAKMAKEYATKKRPLILYYDELVYVAGSANFFKRAPNYYYAVTTGRGQGLGVWGCVQRPSWVPLIALSESDIRFSFYLRKRSDRERAEELLGDIDWEMLKREHTFVAGNDLETSIPSILRFQKGA
jgi:hypothetical protein